MTFPQFYKCPSHFYSFIFTSVSVFQCLIKKKALYYILHHIISLIISLVLICGWTADLWHVLCLMIVQIVDIVRVKKYSQLIKSKSFYFSHLNRTIYHRYFVSTVILSRSGPLFSWLCISYYSTNTVVGCCRQEFVVMITISFSVTQVCVIVHFQSELAPDNWQCLGITPPMKSLCSLPDPVLGSDLMEERLSSVGMWCIFIIWRYPSYLKHLSTSITPITAECRLTPRDPPARLPPDLDA